MTAASHLRVALAFHPLASAGDLVSLWQRLSPTVRERVDEVYGFLFSPPTVEAVALPDKVRLFVNPRDLGYGGNKKILLRYAAEKRFDRVVFVRSLEIPAEELERLLLRALAETGPSVVLGHRRAQGLQAAADRVAANLVLGVRHRSYAHGIQAISREALARVNFEMNSDDERFDVELLIQLRAARIDPVEIEIGVGPAAPARAALPLALTYRLHQLHVLRRGNYLPFGEVQYSFKESPHGSHVQILERVRPEARVLDVGCSQGLLARALRGKRATITGIDVIPRGLVPPDVDRYLECDLDHFTGADLGRDFDYIICADILEHLRDAEALLRVVRRFLKVDGRLIASTGNVAVWFYRLSLLAGRFEYGPRGILDFTHTHLYTCDSFCRLIERAGFRVTSKRFTSLPFEVYFESTGKSHIIKWIDEVYFAMVRFWPRLFAYQIIVEAEVASLEAPRGEGSV
jgi:2-polyprenyl-3-methyl-5-hydroxy-6-metoxy-1,4-benzoquinol methylase